MPHRRACIVTVVKPALVAILAAVALLVVAASAPGQEAIYVVRHAERADQSADPPLSAEGVGRAYRLRDLLKDAGVNRIFTSELRRTIETAAPLAAAAHVTPQVGGDPESLAARIAASGPGDRVLVVGHSNTVPALLRVLGVDAAITIGDSDYDNLFIVVPRREGRPVLLRLKY
jgi:broad specificity phosphatase PhoE